MESTREAPMRGAAAPTQQTVAAATGHHEPRHLLELYHRHFRDSRRERLFLASSSFLATFAVVRAIAYSIRAGVGPFHNVSARGTHVHHLVWGIMLLLGVGYLWLMQIGTGLDPAQRWMRRTALIYGLASALTLDEFALWLNLSDVYWAPKGRESIDAVVLFTAILSTGYWGGPFLRAVVRWWTRAAR